MTAITMQPRRLVFEVWTEQQAIAAAKAAREFDGETIIRWIQPPIQGNWDTSQTISFGDISAHSKS